MSVTYPRGAEWRVWDLQVHTPFSELNNGFGQDLDAYAKAFFEKAIEKRVAVVGVTDYFVVDGYRFLKSLQSDKERLAHLLGAEAAQAAMEVRLFANVELRTNILVNSNRVNYHVIFSDEVSPDDIDHDFLSQLHFVSEGNPDGVDQQLSLTRRNLEDLGKKLKSQHQHFADKSDIFVGMMQATVNHSEVSEVLSKREAKFGNKYIFCVPCDEDLSKISWDSQGHNVRKVLIQKSHALFASNKSTRDFALGLKHPTEADYIREFRSFKPCLHGSDAHRIDELFTPAEGRLTWIKADPTFKGLLQAHNEPDTRVYIGHLPPSAEAVRRRPTKIVNEVSIYKKAESKFPEKWFDQKLQLNPGLVAIIGNKGSGKSALADILGLLGNAPRHQNFSFLSSNRFKDRSNNKAKHFEATVTWADTKVHGPVSLDAVPSDDSVEMIKYIPQDYLEKICNEVSLGTGSRFYNELQHVIFSHVPEAERLGFSSLDNLLRHRSEETKRTIDLLVEEIQAINREIVACEEQLTDSYRKSLEAQLAAKRRELEAHELAKPPLLQRPSEDVIAAQLATEVGGQLLSAQSEIAALSEKIALTKQHLSEATKRRTAAERIAVKLSNLEKQMALAADEADAEVKLLGLKWDDLVKVTIDRSPVETIVQQCIDAVAGNARELDQEVAGSLLQQQAEVQRRIDFLSQKLSAPERAYEEYKAAVKAWEEVKSRIIGNPEQLGTVVQLEAEIDRLPTIKAREQALQLKRVEKAKEIYEEKAKLRNDYGRYYGAVQKFLTEHPLAKSQQFKLTFNVAITEQKFGLTFLKLLNQRRAGTFAGLEEGAEHLRRIVESTNFDVADEAVAFLETIIAALKADQRSGKAKIDVTLRDQLAQGVEVTDLYDYVFGMTYLDPIYDMRWDGKTLEQLSPGERGNLLLIFYLLIDRDDIPLVIDQPEENLDNNTVYRTLVPCIKEAKERRQIIMVTHNPNLAVVCDAEQVICAEILKDQGNKVQYITGSIEELEINRKLVDILEGTRPAFDKRDSKYLLHV